MAWDFGLEAVGAVVICDQHHTREGGSGSPIAGFLQGNFCLRDPGVEITGTFCPLEGSDPVKISKAKPSAPLSYSSTE